MNRQVTGSWPWWRCWIILVPVESLCWGRLSWRLHKNWWWPASTQWCGDSRSVRVKWHVSTSAARPWAVHALTTLENRFSIWNSWRRTRLYHAGQDLGRRQSETPESLSHPRCASGWMIPSAACFQGRHGRSHHLWVGWELMMLNGNALSELEWSAAWCAVLSPARCLRITTARWCWMALEECGKWRWLEVKRKRSNVSFRSWCLQILIRPTWWRMTLTCLIWGSWVWWRWMLMRRFWLIARTWFRASTCSGCQSAGLVWLRLPSRHRPPFLGGQQGPWITLECEWFRWDGSMRCLSCRRWCAS